LIKKVSFLQVELHERFMSWIFLDSTMIYIRRCLFLYIYAGIHGKKSPCYECHVEVRGAGDKTLVLHLFFFFLLWIWHVN
jgi:hypothetical protein